MSGPPPKRRKSSPGLEEGEVADDAGPSVPSSSTLPTKPKVAFPFKKKTTVDITPQNSLKRKSDHWEPSSSNNISSGDRRDDYRPRGDRYIPQQPQSRRWEDNHHRSDGRDRDRGRERIYYGGGDSYRPKTPPLPRKPLPPQPQPPPFSAFSPLSKLPTPPPRALPTGSRPHISIPVAPKAQHASISQPPQPPSMPPPLPRKDVHLRSRKDEMDAYKRVFVGCGVQDDYTVLRKLGEGTFGEVHKAVQKSTNKTVALKRILMHNEKEGMPVTALREIKILKALKHDCIIDIMDMFIVKSTSKEPLSVYMVFPYMDHDLAGLLENERVKLQPSHIKLYMKQLLEGTSYMHRNHILHRDMKAANLLISNDGSLKIADLGLARAFTTSSSKKIKYTNCVVTRWYRPPELLLGATEYGGEIDIWGIGCVLGEMFNRRPILQGKSDIDQLERIWKLCGTPTQHTWPNFELLPGCEGVRRFANIHPRRVKQSYETVGPETCDLLDKLLICNPASRITADEALDHHYFWTEPMPADPKTLPSYEASHEFDKRQYRQMQQPPVPQHTRTMQHNYPPSQPHRFNNNNNRHNNNNHNSRRPPPSDLPPRPSNVGSGLNYG